MAQQELKVRLSADASRFKRGMTSARGSFLNFKTAAVAGAAAVAAGIVNATEAYAEFDQKMTESQAIMGNLSENTMARMEEAARAVGRTTLQSANDAAESFFFLASAGLDAQQSMRALPQVAQFAQAGMFEMKTATDLLTDAQSALGLSMEDPMENMRQMTRLSDVLVKANTLANASVEQFSEALTNRAAAAMRSANIELEEGVSVLAAFADQGIKARRAGMFLSRMLRILRTSAAENTEEFERLGLIDAEGNLASMADIVQILTQELSGLSDTQKAVRLEQLGFTVEIQDAILPLMGASEQIREYEEGLRQAGGTTQEVADKQMDTLSAQVNILTSNLGDMVLSLGKATAETFKLTDAVRGLNTALEKQAIRKFFADAFPLILGQTSDTIDRTRVLSDVIERLAGEVGPKMQDAFRQNAAVMAKNADSTEQAVVAINRMAAQMIRSADEANQFNDEVQTSAESMDQAAGSASDLESELANLPGLGVSGDAGALGDALSVADEMGVLKEYVEMWEEAQSTALNFTETVEEGASVHELIVGQMAEANDEAGDFERGLNSAVDGALQLMQAFGDVDSSVGQALGGVLQLGSAVEGIVNELASAETSFAGIAGGIGAGLGALGSIIGEITRPTAAQRAAQDLQVAVHLLGLNTEKLASVVDRLGTELTKQFLGLAEAFEGLDLGTGFGDFGNVGDALAKFQAELDRLGLNLHDVQSLAQQFGISVDELIKILLTGEGDVLKAGQQLEAFIAMIEELRGVESEATTEAERLAEAMREMSQAFSDARASSQLMMDVFDIEGLSQRMEILFSDLASVMDGALPEIFQQLRMADLSTRSGIEQAKELLQSIFQQGAGAFGLPQDVFREFVSSMDSLLDQALRDLESAAGGGTRTGGGSSGTISVGGSGTSRPDFSQRSVITEVQAEERNVLLRSQLVQEEMQTELQRAMIQVLADLPSNIRDGVDVALGEDQMVGAS